MLDSYSLEQRPLTECCESGNKPSCSVKDANWLSDIVSRNFLVRS
jgi:hypothetical protein